MIPLSTPPNTAVIYTDDHGRERYTRTASKPWRDSTGAGVILVRGHSVRGLVALERVRIASDDEVRA